jgi:hypothetical protein
LAVKVLLFHTPDRIDRKVAIDLLCPRVRTSEPFVRLRGQILEHLNFAGKIGIEG